MVSHLFDLTDKIAVVTGATGVLCSAICHGLAEANATVIVLARDQSKIDTLVQALQEKGAQAVGISADVLDKDSLQRAVKQVMDSPEFKANAEKTAFPSDFQGPDAYAASIKKMEAVYRPLWDKFGATAQAPAPAK